jgi:phosphoribosylglycinamide formyltransferase 1
MSAATTCKLGILLSGRGSNFAAIQQAIESGTLPNAEIAVVISNHTDAPGLALAQSKGIKTVAFEKHQFENRLAFDAAVAEALQSHGVQLVVLAGYDRILGTPVLAAFPNRIINIHPSLLPAYGGKGMVGARVHQAVLEAKEQESGCSVHLVTDVVDGGAILGQSRVAVLENDTPETLAARVLEQEHRLYPQVLRAWIEQHFLDRGELDSHEQDALV